MSDRGLFVALLGEHSDAASSIARGEGVLLALAQTALHGVDFGIHAHNDRAIPSVRKRQLCILSQLTFGSAATLMRWT